MTAVREMLNPSSRQDSSQLDYVQGLRALAVMLVVAFHAGLPVPGGYIGVDIFFVISGFVIGAMLLREINRSGRVDLRRFYRRRIARLVPAMAVVLTSTAIASAILQSPMGSQQDTAIAGLGAATWTANGALYLITGGYFDAAAESQPLLHTWSLSVEEQFYLVFPGLIAIVALVANRRQLPVVRALWRVVCVIAVASFALNIWMTFAASNSIIARPAAAAFYVSPTRAWEFGAGVIVALIVVHGPLPLPFKAAASWAGAALVGIAAVTYGDVQPYPGVFAVVPVIGTCALLLGGTAGTVNAVTQTLSAPISKWIGDISYSLYLWHWPLIIFAGIAWPDDGGAKLAAASLSVPVAWISYIYIETPFRDYTRRNDRLRWKRTIVLLVLPILLFTALYSASAAAWWNPDVKRMAAEVRPVPTGYRSGCHSSVPIRDRNLSPCTHTFGGTQETWLIGDSNAGQYAEAVVAAERHLQGKVVLATASGCPLVDVTIVARGAAVSGCDKYVESTLDWFDAHPSSTILLSSANEAIEDDTVELRDPRTGRTAATSDAKSEIWFTGLDRVLRRLRSAGHRVAVISTIPHLEKGGMSWWSPSSCAFVRMLKDVRKCGSAVTLRSEDHRQMLALKSESTAATANGVTTLNLRKRICPEGKCSAYEGGRWVYRDGLHISTIESESLGPEFIQLLRRLQ